jgi:hypothetical protein
METTQGNPYYLSQKELSGKEYTLKETIKLFEVGQRIEKEGHARWREADDEFEKAVSEAFTERLKSNELSRHIVAEARMRIGKSREFVGTSMHRGGEAYYAILIDGTKYTPQISIDLTYFPHRATIAKINMSSIRFEDETGLHLKQLADFMSVVDAFTDCEFLRDGIRDYEAKIQRINDDMIAEKEKHNVGSITKSMIKDMETEIAAGKIDLSEGKDIMVIGDGHAAKAKIKQVNPSSKVNPSSILVKYYNEDSISVFDIPGSPKEMVGGFANVEDFE